jgi:phosphoribosylglycinamide formyltransferase-1
LIISNTNKAKGLKYAEQFKIKKKIFNFRNTKIAEKNILTLITKNQIRFICLAGFMKILSKDFIEKFNGKIINIHPSLLPKYKGLNTHEKAIKNRDKFTGCTVHYVSAKLDSGKIILQKKVLITTKDSRASLAKKVLKAEHKLYPAAIMKIFN